MKVTLRTVSGESFTLEVLEETTVADLKARVVRSQGRHCGVAAG